MAVIQNWTASMGNPMARGGAGDNSWMPTQRGILDPDVERQAQAAELGQRLQQDRFNQVFPFLQSQLGNVFAQSTTPGGSSGQSPEITVGPVWNPQQIQQQVNSQRAANDQATQGRIQGVQRQVGASGFGSNSPLAMALSGNLQNQNLATNTANERDTRMQARQANVGNIYQTQMGREQQFANRQDEDIRRRVPYFQQANALISALAGLV